MTRSRARPADVYTPFTPHSATSSGAAASHLPLSRRAPARRGVQAVEDIFQVTAGGGWCGGAGSLGQAGLGHQDQHHVRGAEVRPGLMGLVLRKLRAGWAGRIAG
jgi:hypothetical protein